VDLARPWFEALPDRFSRELEDLGEAGAIWEIDEKARAAGLLRLNRLAWQFGEDRLELVAEYPDLYPYFRPEVRAPNLKLPRHQSPAGNLCLVNRDTRNWDVDDTLATYLDKRLELTIRAASTNDPDEAAKLEEHQGEPLSDYLPYSGAAILLVDGHWQIPDGETMGELLVGLDPNLDLGQGMLRGAVLEVRGMGSAVLARAPDSLARLFRARLTAPWVRVGNMPTLPDVGAILSHVREIAPAAVFPRAQSVGSSRLALLGLLFTEELGYRTTGASWVFALEWTQ
jgi:hypothetical protein